MWGLQWIHIIASMVLLSVNGKYPTNKLMFSLKILSKLFYGFQYASTLFMIYGFSLKVFTIFYLVMDIMFKFTNLSCLRFMHFLIFSTFKVMMHIILILWSSTLLPHILLCTLLAYFMSSLSVDTPWLYSYCISFISCLCQVSSLEPLRVLYCNNTSRVYFGL